MLRPWIATIPEGNLVQLDGRPVADIKSAWRRLREKAGLGDEVIPYTICHTVATHLHASGVPIEQIAAFLGLTQPGDARPKDVHFDPSTWAPREMPSKGS